jgi:hypothetical protein
MDRIEPNSTPRSVHPNNPQQSRDTKRAETISPPREVSQKNSAYSDIFDDRELECLQNNLQPVSELANKALERLKK